MDMWVGKVTFEAACRLLEEDHQQGVVGVGLRRHLAFIQSFHGPSQVAYLTDKQLAQSGALVRI